MKELFLHIWIPTLGLTIGFAEFIVLMTSQFYIMGFLVSTLVIIMSAIFLCMRFSDYKKS